MVCKMNLAIAQVKQIRVNKFDYQLCEALAPMNFFKNMHFEGPFVEDTKMD